MKYRIVRNGKVIAMFLARSDRDLCLATLRETYDDCIFEAQDEAEYRPKSKEQQP